MIFATFGNVPLSFERLARAIDELAAGTEEVVVAQNGHTRFPFAHARAVAFLSADEMMAHLTEARLVVTHGGYGTIRECLDLGKVVVAVPRRAGIEHHHDQAELVRALEEGGHLLAVYDAAELAGTVARAASFQPQPLPRGQVAAIVAEFLGGL